MTREDKLIFKIDTNDPIYLDDFTSAIIAIGDEFKRFRQGFQYLQISKVREGSYEVEFLAVATSGLFCVLQNTNTVFEFISYIKSIIPAFLTRSPTLDSTAEETIKNVGSIVSPVIYNSGNINIYSGNESITILNTEAQTIKKNVSRTLKDGDVVQNKVVCNKVLFYWNQTSFDKNKPNVGNKGVIETICIKPITVIFEDDTSMTKTEMTTSINGVDWQERGYIVDVEVMYKGNGIVKYKILHNYMEDSILPEIRDENNCLF